MEDGPNWTDNPVTTGTDTTNKERILRECSCGWSKVTTYLGLRIHQGKAKCGRNTQAQACTAAADQTRRNSSPVEHHSATDPTIALGRMTPEQPPQVVVSHPPQMQQPEYRDIASEEPERATTTMPCRKVKVKWPKASEKNEW